MFTSITVFVLLLFFTTFSMSSSPPISIPSFSMSSSPLMPPFSMSGPSASPLFFRGTETIEEDEKKTDEDEKNFISDYDSKNKQITSLKNSLNVCRNNRSKMNEAINQLRVDAINTVDNAYTTAEKNSNECRGALDTRIPKYIAAYNKKYGIELTIQQVNNKIATGQLMFK